MSPSIARKVLSKMQSVSSVIKPEETPDYHLTAREKEVLSCLVNGLSYKMIGSELNISYETVRSHVKRSMKITCGVSDRSSSKSNPSAYCLIHLPEILL
jgi:DNA-binding NarL/FixJ family response regulator